MSRTCDQKIRFDFFAPHSLEKQPLFVMIFYGCFTPRVENGFVAETILNQHSGVGTAFFMNNRGYIKPDSSY